ncbi:MAG TPA: UDP-N-acetylmuramoyl-tripeptide--D-alanyl-D-alanine ligase [Thermoleophilaceae bacterium]|nr:UDP-N-acetylmuramoyl-tripeptide--D-alanyl-D-alanine ligase [Thermoleophilaceae bacterium]
MIDLSTRELAECAGAELAAGDPEATGPERVVVDTRELRPGDLFVGLPGGRVDGGEFAAQALEAGAWGVLVEARHASSSGTVLVADDPLASLGRLARAWRRKLGCPVVGITGSTGKTSTKDILAALLAPRIRTHANRENLNTEIGLPLSLLAAPLGTEVAVLEMAMRGEGQIAELAGIAEPDVGVIVNVGPVHLELLGTVERVAAAKAELIRDLPEGAACVLPDFEPLLDTHLRDDLDTWTFGPAGQVKLLSYDRGHAEVEARGELIELDLGYSEPHNLLNTLAAVAAARALGLPVGGSVEVSFSSLRGEVVELPGGVVVVNDCYNANPMSMRAALDHLAESPAERRIAVLGTMAELGGGSAEYHRAVGEHAAAREIDVLVPVGEEALPYLEGFDGEVHPVGTPEQAGALLEEVARPGDRVLVKGSRSAGLERVLAVA